MSEPASRERLYLAFAVLGFLVTTSLVVVFLAESGFDIGKMFEDAVANTIALAILCDLIISSLVFWSWAVEEGPRLGIDHWWLVFPVTLIFGLCVGLPLFMYWRERALAGAGTAAPA